MLLLLLQDLLFLLPVHGNIDIQLYINIYFVLHKYIHDICTYCEYDMVQVFDTISIHDVRASLNLPNWGFIVLHNSSLHGQVCDRVMSYSFL